MTGSLRLLGGRLPGEDGLVDVSIVDGVIVAIDARGASDGGAPAASAPAPAQRTAAPSPRDAEHIDLGGRFLVPGLWDNHVHFSQWAAVSRRLDVSAAGSAAETAQLVLQACRAAADGASGAAGGVGTSPGAMIVGFGFRDGLWADEPTAAVLDAVAGPRPVVLVSGDLHCVWLNSAALAQFGRAGHPTGVLREEEAFAVHRALDDVPAETVDGWALDAARAAAARGVVGIVDLEMAWNPEVWSRRAAAGHDLLRVEFGVYPQHLDRAVAEGLRTGAPLVRAGGTDDDLIHVGPFKVITDGSLNTRTAFCFDEYPGLEGRADSHGLLTVAPDELRALLERAVAAGFVPAVHAIGDHANRLTLDAFEALGGGGSLEHAQLLAETDLPRFGQLGVTASVQPEHAMDDRDVADRYWAGRTGRSFALASLLAAGATLALGSDAPVAPLDPWVMMAAAVGRARDGREPWHPEQRITAADALAASARGRDRVRVGDVADLAVTDADPLASSAESLRHMPVALTLLAGRATHRAL
ncbi:amidohydrolase family protein [Herbiconiux daphne]|uniref:Amidohydrolase family protein n=1 Tax=Herbiconiux daphne TaxID=2970914 RepID=A0ABT2GYR1_9MICO|nr:amidohydrolase family protein [Herbiconiux daphne]MCS5733098.1 amidohydrolase family protein [Herbiconiux daphne]